jgi:hypothetical protein
MIKNRKNIFIVIPLIISLIFLMVPNFGKAGWVGTQNNATLMLSPNSGVYRASASFLIDILVNTHGQDVVVVAVYISYNTSLFQVASIDTSNSIFTTEAEKIIDSINGVIKITRGIPAPGVNVTNGKVATINIIGLTDAIPSSDNFNFQFTAGSTADSNIILNDGLGTDIMSGADNGRYTIDGIPPVNVSNFTATAGSGQVSLGWTNPASDFAGVKILRKTGSYPTSVTDGTVIYDSNGTSFADNGLTNGTTYYYKAYSRDIVLNYSSGAQVSATPQDNIAPAQIATLSATALTSRTIRLDWTAVGDDGTTGTATSYNIRYSTTTITSVNFTSAMQVSGAPTPKANGSAETMTVSGLSGNTTYYFAIKAVDEAGNASSISNVVNAKTYKTSDLNNDNIVNSVDFGILMSYWGSTARPPADINQDGATNSVDFGIMMSQWG